MSLYGIDDETRCANCHREFADHDYVPDSIDGYRCPVKQQESGYGYFCGGDPRNFYPDSDCSEQEIANWKQACEFAETKGLDDLECPSGWIYDAAGKPVMHILRAPFGIGVYTYEYETFFEAMEADCDFDIAEDE